MGCRALKGALFAPRFGAFHDEKRLRWPASSVPVPPFIWDFAKNILHLKL
jgi:hypothetical protein